MKRSLQLFCILCFLFPGFVRSQIAAAADTLSSFPGGDAAFKQFIAGHLRITREALAAKVNGDVEMSFAIDEKGYAGDFKTISRLGYGCEEQVISMLHAMPRWQPGVIAGRRISTTFRHHFHFSDNMKVNDSTAVVTRAMIPNAPAQFGKNEGDLNSYLTKHFTWPAKLPKDISGSIVLQFKIDENGNTTDVRIVTGIVPELDDAVVRLFANMPAWTAKQADFKPAVSYNELIIGFKNGKLLLH